MYSGILSSCLVYGTALCTGVILFHHNLIFMVHLTDHEIVLSSETAPSVFLFHVHVVGYMFACYTKIQFK